MGPHSSWERGLTHLQTWQVKCYGTNEADRESMQNRACLYPVTYQETQCHSTTQCLGTRLHLSPMRWGRSCIHQRGDPMIPHQDLFTFYRRHLPQLKWNLHRCQTVHRPRISWLDNSRSHYDYHRHLLQPLWITNILLPNYRSQLHLVSRHKF